MATSDILGLFTTPEQYQLTQDEAARQRALSYAQLDPRAQAQYGFYRAGQQLGNAIGGALGGQDPQLKMISQRQQLASQINMTDPASISQGVQMASQLGDVQLATALADRLKTLQESTSKLALESASTQEKLATVPKLKAEAGKIVGETLTKEQTIQSLKSQFGMNDADATAIASNPQLVQAYLTPTSAKAFDVIKTGKYTPESSALYAQTGNLADLEMIDKMAKPNGDFLSKAQELNIGVKPLFGDYTPEETAKINKALMNDQTALASAKATSIRISNNVQQEQEFAKKRGVTQATELDNATNLARGASQALNTVRSMKQLNDSGQLFTGPVAQSYVGATNLLSSLNLLSPAQAKMLTSSQVYDKQAKDLVMNELAGKLGAGISEGDRKFIEDRIPQLTTSPAARTELLNKIESLQKDKIKYWKDMNSHANKYGNLNDFDFAENYSPISMMPPATGGNWSIKPKP
jgi:hypothetical protein